MTIPSLQTLHPVLLYTIITTKALSLQNKKRYKERFLTDHTGSSHVLTTPCSASSGPARGSINIRDVYYRSSRHTCGGRYAQFHYVVATSIVHGLK